MPAPIFDPSDRALARDWLDFATDEGRGRRLRDPVYQSIVEGRDPGPRYSSCADLAHWLLFRLGCRERWINRVEHLGYKPIVNVGRLTRSPVGSNPYAEMVVTIAPPEDAKTGDILISWSRSDTTDAHVQIFDRIEHGRVLTWDAGRGPMATSAWKEGANYIECARVNRPIGEKHYRSILRLARLPFTAAPDLPIGEVFDAIEAG